MSNQGDRYDRLKLELDKIKWPSFYLYKFIIRTEEKDKINTIKNNFMELKPDIYTKISSKGTFVSISVKVKMESSNHVIEKYIDLEGLEGIISL